MTIYTLDPALTKKNSLPWGREFHGALVKLTWSRLEALINAGRNVARQAYPALTDTRRIAEMDDADIRAKAQALLKAARVPRRLWPDHVAAMGDLRRNVRRGLATMKGAAPRWGVATVPLAFHVKNGRPIASYRTLDWPAAVFDARAILGPGHTQEDVERAAARAVVRGIESECFFLLAALGEPSTRERFRLCVDCGHVEYGDSARLATGKNARRGTRPYRCHDCR